MPGTFDPKTANDLITRTVTALAGEDAAKQLSASVDASFELARQTVNSGTKAKHEPAISSIRVTVTDLEESGAAPTTAIFDKRSPIDAGPKKGTPIRVGGGHCFTVTVGKVTVTICIDWHS